MTGPHRADVTTIKDVVLNNFRFDALPLDGGAVGEGEGCRLSRFGARSLVTACGIGRVKLLTMPIQRVANLRHLQCQDQCPYSAKRCVPMPGVEFQECAPLDCGTLGLFVPSGMCEELTAGYCTFSMTADVVNGLGEAFSSTFESLGRAIRKARASVCFLLGPNLL